MLFDLFKIANMIADEFFEQGDLEKQLYNKSPIVSFPLILFQSISLNEFWFFSFNDSLPTAKNHLPPHAKAFLSLMG